MKRNLSWCVRRASKNPSTPSPGKPKMVSIPHSTIRSTIKSEPCFAIYSSLIENRISCCEFLGLGCLQFQTASRSGQVWRHHTADRLTKPLKKLALNPHMIVKELHMNHARNCAADM